MRKYMTVTVKDGSKWAVPVELIARNRAENYASEFGGDIELSLVEDTIPLFESDDYEIEDWATNNMDWKFFDVNKIKIEPAPPPDFQDAWINGDKGFIEI